MHFRFFTGFLLLTTVFSSLSAQSGVIQAGGSRIERNPASLPEELQEWLLIPGASIHTTGTVTGSSFMTPGEGLAVLRSETEPSEILKYYNEEFRKNRWTVLQSGQSEGKTLIMAESPYKRLVTVIITSDRPSFIKIYYKRSGNE